MADYKIIEELKKYASLQEQLAFVQIANDVRSIKQNANIKVKNIHEYIDNSAKIYGQNIEKTKELKDSYAISVEVLTNKYYFARIGLEKTRLDIQNKEMEAIGRITQLKNKVKEIKKTDLYKSWKAAYEVYVNEYKKERKSGDLTKYYNAKAEMEKMEKENPVFAQLEEIKSKKQEIADSRTLLSDNQDKINQLRADATESLGKVMGEESTSLAKIEKQNALQKFIGAFVNKINGSKKFLKRVEEPLRTNLDKFRDNVLPVFLDKVDGIIDRIDGSYKNDEKNRENREMKGKNAFDITNMIRNSKQKKDNLINGIANAMHNKNEKTQERISNLRKEGPSLEV